MKRRLGLAVMVVMGAAGAVQAEQAAPAPSQSAAAAPVKKEAAPPPAPKEGETTYAFLKAPLFSEQFAGTPVATVEDQAITLKELTEAIAGAHGGHEEGEKAGKKDFTPILDRLIEAKLMVLEAREMGIDELPEYKQALEEFKVNVAQEILKERVVKGIDADPAEAEHLYKDAVREWKVNTVLVDRREYADELMAQVKAGKSFEAAGEQIAAEKKGKTSPAEFLPRLQMRPEVVQALSGLKVGEISKPVKVKEGFAVMKIEDERYPDVPKVRADAEAASRSNRHKAALTKYYVEVVKRYAVVDQRLLDRLDFNAKKPGLAALAKDQRAIARIKGGKPVTVADLTTTLTEGFFHGVEGALKEKKLNAQKYQVFDGLLSRRVLPLEVERERITEGAEFARRVKDWETTKLFTQVVGRVILPEVKVGEPELRKYYDAHKTEFAVPAMYRLESLVFKSAKEAQGAVDQLRSGTDFKWLNANAEGQVDPKERKLRLEGVLASTTLPPDVAKALDGTKKGDLRLYLEPGTSHYHAIRVVDVTPGGPQPFEEVQGAVQQKVYPEAIRDGIHAYAAKLRKVRDVKVYLTRIGG